VYTGTGIDTQNMRVFIPQERKVEILRLVIDTLRWFTKDKPTPSVTTRSVARLAGKLMFTCRAMPSGKPFCWAIMQAACATTKNTTLSVGIQRDLQWWQSHLPEWNGSHMLNLTEWVQSIDIGVETDASMYGWGAYYQEKYAHGKWTRDERICATRTRRISMPYMELYAITQAALLWGEQWRGRKITFIGDCKGLIAALNKDYLRKPGMASLLRVLANSAVTHNYQWRCHWVTGESNIRADPLSRGQVEEFLLKNPSSRGQEVTRTPLGTPLGDPLY
jgi:hypothetical protein